MVGQGGGDPAGRTVRCKSSHGGGGPRVLPSVTGRMPGRVAACGNLWVTVRHPAAHTHDLGGPRVPDAPATRLPEQVGYVGFPNVDLKDDRRDGTLRFLTSNVRLGRSDFSVTACGNNLAQWSMRDRVRHEDLHGVEIPRGEHQFAFVPTPVVRHDVLDPVLRDKASALMKAGRAR